MKSDIKMALVLGIAISVVIVGISFGLSTLEDNIKTQSEKEQGTDTLSNIDKSKFKKAPDLVGIAHYVNTTPEKLKEAMKDKVVLYDIWTYSCINCIRTIPYITEWNEKYSDDGLLIIGIHSPEFEFEKDFHNVEMAVDKHGITYPVVLDNEWKTWKAFENRYWPHKYLVDHEGYIRYDHIGEGAYQETERVIQQLLIERANDLGLIVANAESFVDIEEFKHSNFRTPELYFGYKFIQGRNQLGNQEGFDPQNEVEYKSPENLKQHYFYLDGIWKNLEDSMKLVSDEGRIKLLYHAKEVNIVAANNADLEIYLDGNPIPTNYAGKSVDENGQVIISEAGLYNIITSEEANTHLLEIFVNDPGFEIYTFTFG